MIQKGDYVIITAGDRVGRDNQRLLSELFRLPQQHFMVISSAKQLRGLKPKFVIFAHDFYLMKEGELEHIILDLKTMGIIALNGQELFNA